MTTVEDDRPTATVGLRRLLRDLDGHIARAMRINLDPAGLSLDEWAVLCLLSDGAGHSMAEVIDATGVPGPTATRLIDKLVSNALLHRTVDPTDRRKVLVALAPRGRDLYDRLAPAHAEIAGLVEDRIGREEYAELTARLRAAIAAFGAG